MSTSSPGPPHEPQAHLPEVTRPSSALTIDSGHNSPVDSPYNNGRSPSGHLAPYSPAPARHYSRDHILWMTGGQTSFHDEPGSMSLLRTNSSTTVYTHHGNLPSSSDTNTHQLHLDRAIETYSGSPDASSFPQSPDTGGLEPNRGTPYSIKSSSQYTISQKSYSSRSSTGRASYRKHHGPPARDHTPTPEKIAPTFSSPSSRTLEMAGPSGSAAFPAYIAPPSVHDRNMPGEPVIVGHRFYPMSVNGKIRYENRNTRLSSENDHMIEKMLYRYPKTPEVPSGWTACRHPEGALYFMHKELVSEPRRAGVTFSRKTFTEVNICDPDVHGDIEYFRTFLFQELITEIEREGLSDSLNEVELVLEPKIDDQGVMCCYYFVNPPARSVFWLDEWKGDEIFKDCKGKLSDAHKGEPLDYLTLVRSLNDLKGWLSKRSTGALYSNHWDLFPNYRQVTQTLKDEVVDMILHGTCDHLTSDTSTCPLSVEELKNHLAIVDRIDSKQTGERGHCAVVIGRIMHAFYHAYFINYYGEDCARLNFDQTVHGWIYRPSWLMTIIAPLLFMAPISKLRLLHRIFVDDIASKERWNMFLTRLNSQFQAISVLATVLLNANVAFLPTTKDSGSGGPPQQYLAYMSLVTSMASIILGLVFMGNNRLEDRIAPSKVATFLHRLQDDRHGLEILAIIYSLPYASLMWGMILFFAAFVTQWVYPGPIVSQAGAGAFILVVALLVAWSIWTARDTSDPWWFLPDQKMSGHKQQEDEPENHFGIPHWLGFLCGLKTSNK